MSNTKHFTSEDKMEEMEWDAKQDEMIDHMYCLKCGNNPEIWPIWTGKENWYAGECDTCNENAEFTLDPIDAGGMS
tara:strand:- start:2754 stop:2981 length:228 start_codon:yes stop_codon:yes gene_type:complete